VFDVVEPGPLSVPVAVMFTVPARTPVTVLVATPPEAAALPVPETVPPPLACSKSMLMPLSGPVVIVFPALSSTVAVTSLPVPEARLAVDPDNTIFDAVPDASVTACVLLVAAHECHLAVTV
jgi:hypothetical protein